jgi:hypothetical protein
VKGSSVNRRGNLLREQKVRGSLPRLGCGEMPGAAPISRFAKRRKSLKHGARKAFGQHSFSGIGGDPRCDRRGH